jgi:hypothetical protein
MSTNKILELILLQEIFYSFNTDIEYNEFLSKNYNVEKINSRYLELGKEFLNDYALDKTEKSD